MNCNIKYDFSANDLAVGDMMYDAKDDLMVEVVFINKINKASVPVTQFVLEDTTSGVIFMITSVGEKGPLPNMLGGKSRFRHLMKFSDPVIINWPDTYPVYPLYPYNQPYNPWNYPIYCGDTSQYGDSSTSINDPGGCTTSQCDVSNDLGIAGVSTLTSAETDQNDTVLDTATIKVTYIK